MKVKFLYFINHNKYVIAFKDEREILINEIDSLRLMLKESENLNTLLQGKCDYIEKLTEQLENEYRVIDDLKKVLRLVYYKFI